MVVSGTLTAGAITLKTTAVASMVQFTTAFANGTAIFNVTDGTDLYDIPTAIGGVAVEQGRVVYVYSDAPSATVNSNPIMQGQIAMFVFVAGNWVKL